MRKSIPLTGISALAVGLLLSACATSANNSGGEASGAPTESEGVSPKLTNCTNKMKNDAPQVSVWAWYPNMADVVDNFNEAHTDVQICWNNVGQGNDEYTKVQTAISAGKGLADVVMLEADRLSSFAIQGALVDLTAVRRRRGEGQLQRGRLEGRLAGQQGGRHPRRRRAGGHDLPHRRVQEVRHHPAHHLGGVRHRRPEGQGRRGPRLR